MSDWPDDWFRGGAGGAGAKPAGASTEPPTVQRAVGGANQPVGAFGAAEPTVQAGQGAPRLTHSVRTVTSAVLSCPRERGGIFRSLA